MCRNGWVWVTRWPANTALPFSPGKAVPGQWLGPRSMLRIVMPWKIGLTRPIFGISMVPIWMIGSGAYACDGGLIGRSGTASCAAAGGRVVDVDVVVVRAG